MVKLLLQAMTIVLWLFTIVAVSDNAKLIQFLWASDKPPPPVSTENAAPLTKEIKPKKP